MALKTIDGVTYSLVPVGAWEAIPLFHSLVTIIGSMTPVLADLIGADRSKPLLDAIDLDKLFEALPTFMERCSPEKQRELIELMLANCQFRKPQAKGARPPKVAEEEVPLLGVFDTELSGKLFTVYRLVAWAIQVNFADFFAGAKLASAAKQAAASAAAQLKTPDSTPSDSTPPAEG